MENFSVEKKEAVQWIDENKEQITEMSDRIWFYAEIALAEYRASRLLTNVLKKAGFKVELGVAGLETAFVATYGEGRPVLSTIAEYEAVEDTSQMPVPYKQPVLPGLAGCYDMHHGLGSGAVGAALAIKHVMEKYKLPGTFKVFGTPCEKKAMGKMIMASKGIFDHLDGCVAWHPADETGAHRFITTLMRAVSHTLHSFEGVSCFSAMPWGGHNAFHAIQLMDMAVNMIKDTIVPITSFPTISSIPTSSLPPKDPITFTISSIPSAAQITYSSRALNRKELEKIRKRLFDCADAAALALGVTVKNEILFIGWEAIPNYTLAHAAHKNIEVIGAPKFTAKDFEYGRLIQKQMGMEPTDTPFGDMSIVPPGTKPVRNSLSATDATVFCYKCPFTMLTTNYLLWGMPNWATASFAITNIAHQAFLTAAKFISTTIIDLFKDPSIVREAKEEFWGRTKDTPWVSPIPADRPVPKVDPFPKEHYLRAIEAFRKGPKWEGWEPELSARMERIAQKVLKELGEPFP